ncbi:12983_t:CDS:2, partial [Dentiscutata erythropus]
SYEDKFISPIATGNISPYTSSHSPLTSLSGQSSQYIVSNDVNSVDNSPYSHYLTPILINPLNILYLTNQLSILIFPLTNGSPQVNDFPLYAILDNSEINPQKF